METKDMENQDGDIPDEPGQEVVQDEERDWLGDHPEFASDESRISVVTGRDRERESVRRTANTGDIVEDAGDAATGAGPNPELDFDRNNDYMGNEASIAETEDFARGSGSLAERQPVEEADGAEADVSESGEVRSDGAPSGSAAIGRDIGASGLPGDRTLDAEEDERPRRPSHASDWTAVLGRLGGSSPGSEENQQLAERFAGLRFPASREEALRSLPAAAEFRARSVSVDLREAIADSRTQTFRNLYDLIDAVKDEIRRAEKRHPA